MSDYGQAISTQRLALVPWRADMAAEYVRLMANPEVVRYGYTNPLSTGRAMSQLGSVIEEWEVNGFGSYAIVDTETSLVGGYAGVHAPWSFPELSPIMEVGVRIVPEWWGTGRALEALTPIMDIGFDVLNAAGLAGIFLPANKGARDINARLGMSFHSKTVYPGRQLAIEIHVATRESWGKAKVANSERRPR